MCKATRLAAGLITLVLLAVGCGQVRTPRAATEPRTAPDFSLTAFDGAAYSLAELKGTPIVLNFWSAGCPACTTALPHLEALYQKHKSDGLLVLGVAGFDSEQALKEKAKSLGLTYPIAISPEAGRAYRVHAVPVTFYINRESEIVSSLLGARDASEFEAEAQKIL